MAIQINMTATHKGGKLERLREYLRDPFKPKFIRAVRDQLILNVQTAGSRPLGYHTYHSSQHEDGNLEQSCFVDKQGTGGIILGSYENYAGVLEFGRRALRRRKKPFVFKGYYANPTAIRMFLSNAKPTSGIGKKLYSPMWGEFAKWRSGVQLTRGAGKKGLKAQEVSMSIRHTPKGKSIRYDPSLTGEAMRKQNIAFIGAEAKGKTWDDMMRIDSSKPHHSIEAYSKSHLGDIGYTPSKGRARFRIKGKKAYKGSLPYGIYTVFSTKLKGIRPYHVFTKTAEWAEQKFVNEVKIAVRKIDMNMAT